MDKPTCTIDGCTNQPYGRGWCLFHYKRWHRSGSPHRLCKGCGNNLPENVRGYCSKACKPLCSIDGCGKPESSKGWCKTHYERDRRWGSPHLRPAECVTCGTTFPVGPMGHNAKFCSDECKTVCSIPGCTRVVKSRTWCHLHYRRYETHGTPTPVGVREWATEWVCVVCGADVPKGSGRRAHCSNRCQVIWARHGENLERVKECVQCGDIINMFETDTPNRMKRRSDTALCGSCRRRDTRAARRLLADLLIRDFLICGICDQPVDPDLKWPAHRSVTVDHIIPVAHGGSDDIENLQLAHLACNATKQDRVGFKIA